MKPRVSCYLCRMITYYLLLGSNLGEREKNLAQALVLLAKEGMVVTKSSVYETEPWGKKEQPAFLNMAVELDTMTEPTDMMKKILSIEKQMGRERKEKWGERLIDIDILLCSRKLHNIPVVQDEEGVNIPHQHLHERRFALVPLCEIAPNIKHSSLKKTVRQLLEECTDRGEVKKI